ncbi:MAG: glycoside hydrolase family 1 protein [bacterium]|nr:glycoside hydrolase family 1 protein [bacterium]
MNAPSDKFPKGFFWGSSTAAYQVEGGIENTDWAKAGREGKVPPAGKACDHYNRFEEDFAIAQSLGHNAHRFSIEWARIEPEEGRFDEREIEHYRMVLSALKSRGLEPFVNLWHFTLPTWFAEKGGFGQKDAPRLFARYCAYVTQQLGNRSHFWLTINEPLIWASGGYLKGKWPPFRKNPLAFIAVQSALIAAHKEAYRAMKNINPTIAIGVAKNNIYFSADRLPWNILAKEFMNWFWNRRFLDAIAGYQDFIGLNHYFYKHFGRKKELPRSDMGWDIYPEAIYHCLVDLKKYKKPVYVSENGIADEADTQRGDFIKNYLFYVKKAIDEGADIRGYFYWSLLDNFEWSFGFQKKFGLVAFDPVTFARTIRSSAFVYQKIIENQSV